MTYKFIITFNPGTLRRDVDTIQQQGLMPDDYQTAEIHILDGRFVLTFRTDRAPHKILRDFDPIIDMIDSINIAR